MSQKYRQVITNLKKSLKNKEVFQIKNQMREQFSQSHQIQFTEQTQSNRSSCFPKRSYVSHKESLASSEQQSSNTETKYESMNIQDVLEKDQIKRSFDYLYHHFSSNEVSFITNCIKDKINQYQKIVKVYLLKQISIDQIIQKKLLDWNLIVSSMFWVRWTQNYRILQKLSFIVVKIFFKIYKFYMVTQLDSYFDIIVRNEEIAKKNQVDYQKQLKDFQVYDIIIQKFFFKSYIKKTLNAKYQICFQQNLAFYIIQKLQVYEDIFLKYSIFRQEVPVKNNMKSLQSILLIKCSNYHQMVFNDNMDIMVSKIISDIQIRDKQLLTKLEQTQELTYLQSECSLIKAAGSYIAIRMIVNFSDEDQNSFQLTKYQNDQIYQFMEYLKQRIVFFQNVNNLNMQSHFERFINSVIIFSSKIYQFDDLNIFLGNIKEILNTILNLFRDTQKYAYMFKFYQYLQMHNNLINLVLSIQQQLCYQVQSNCLKFSRTISIQYLEYLQSMLYHFFLNKNLLRSALNHEINISKNQIYNFEYNLLSLLKTSFLQKNMKIITQCISQQFLMKAIQQYGIDQKNLLDYGNQNYQNIISAGNVKYFFEIIKDFSSSGIQSNEINPQMQI